MTSEMYCIIKVCHFRRCVCVYVCVCLVGGGGGGWGGGGGGVGTLHLTSNNSAV